MIFAKFALILSLIKSDPSPSLLFFFKPECPICIRQARNFSCLESLEKVHPVGFNATKKEIWRETRKLKLEKNGFKKVFLANNLDLKATPIKGNESPQLLFYKEGKLTKHHLGFMECEKIKNLLSSK